MFPTHISTRILTHIPNHVISKILLYNSHPISELMKKHFAKPQFPIKPQFSMIMMCSKIPEMKSVDFSAWRRIKIIPFQSEFI